MLNAIVSQFNFVCILNNYRFFNCTCPVSVIPKMATYKMNHLRKLVLLLSVDTNKKFLTDPALFQLKDMHLNVTLDRVMPIRSLLA